MMKKSCWLGLILLTGFLTGCGSHLSAGLTASRQLPVKSASRDGIAIHLNRQSELQLNLRGFRMGLRPQTEPLFDAATQSAPPPWLSYHLHF
jgi:outer membrane lipopolysaccharide assembly protein LptE/RlpB